MATLPGVDAVTGSVPTTDAQFGWDRSAKTASFLPIQARASNGSPNHRGTVGTTRVRATTRPTSASTASCSSLGHSATVAVS